MKISAAIGVRDDVELIGPLLEHLRRIGVDHIIGSDGGSTDGTAEVLQAAPDVEFMPYDDTRPGTDARVGTACLDAARAAGSDWLLFCDGDEFWLPVTGSLKDLALDGLDALTVPRFNVPLLPHGPAIGFPAVPSTYDEILLYAPGGSITAVRKRIQQDADAPWIGIVPAEKQMVRPSRAASVIVGGHAPPSDAKPSETMRTRRANDVLVAHVPFSTEARFARKIDNITRLVAASGHRWGAKSAWHWRRWLDNIEAGGGVAGEIARNTVSPEELADLRRSEVVKSAAELFARGRF